MTSTQETASVTKQIHEFNPDDRIFDGKHIAIFGKIIPDKVC